MLDVLGFGAHPDDCEIFMGGTLLQLKSRGCSTGICDLCSGEAGTYGSAETRKKELEMAGAILGLDQRITLDMPDSNIRNTGENRLKIIEVIRRLKPEIIFTFTPGLIRHPDHKYCGEMVRECSFLSGIEKIVTESPPHRPSAVITFPELVPDRRPDIVVDITGFWEKKLEAIRCYSTQVIAAGEDDSGTRTLIRSNRMWEMLESRSVQAGAMIGVRYGEPYYCDSPPRIYDFLESFKKELK